MQFGTLNRVNSDVIAYYANTLSRYKVAITHSFHYVQSLTIIL